MIDKPMYEHLPGMGISGHQHGGPEDRMKTINVLSDHMGIRGPEGVEQVIILQKSDSGQVV